MAVFAVHASAAPGVFDTDIPTRPVSQTVGEHGLTPVRGRYLDWRMLLRQSDRSRRRYAR